MPPSPNVPANYFMHPVPTLSVLPSSCGGIERPDSEILRDALLSCPGQTSMILRSDPILFLQDIDAKLMALKARFDASWQEWQDLLGQKQDALTWRSAQMPSMYKPTNLLPNKGGAWIVAPHTPAPPQPFPSSPIAITSTQPKTHSRPTYTAYNREGTKIFRCQCGYETVRKGGMTRHHQSLVHASKNQVCPCGKRYTRKDSLRRHKMTCIPSVASVA